MGLSLARKGMNLPWMKKAVAAWAPCPETSRPTTEPTAEKPMSVKVEPPLKRLKNLGDSLALVQKPKPSPKVLRGEGSS
ncbi:hypothetical protein B296_00031445 [Ensete ventricosum]|uniref:Uncharacterized protein n=1 Tax=Ensete ventricosum TaxID=4639 RepID=A0A426YUR5_ENSVE|nr:hypothetical protein B296_00031445 [Ensete ventricosum]